MQIVRLLVVIRNVEHRSVRSYRACHVEYRFQGRAADAEGQDGLVVSMNYAVNAWEFLVDLGVDKSFLISFGCIFVDG